jgi:hypothetical protein
VKLLTDDQADDVAILGAETGVDSRFLLRKP